MGLDWDWQTHGGEIVVPVDDYEEFRGGNTPEEDEESEEEEVWFARPLLLRISRKYPRHRTEHMFAS